MTRNRGGRAGALWGALVALSGCGGTQLEDSGDVDVATLLDRVEATYRAMDTYEHETQETTLYVEANGNAHYGNEETAHLRFQRPDWYAVDERSDSGDWGSIRNSVGNAVESWDDGKLGPVYGIDEDDVLNLLSDSLFETLRTFRVFENATLVGRTVVDGIDCYELLLVEGKGRERVWIDAKEYLLRKRERFDVLDVAARTRAAEWLVAHHPDWVKGMLEHARDPANDYTSTTTTWIQPRVNGTLAETSFVPSPGKSWTRYHGIGVRLSLAKGARGVAIEETFADSAASRAGLRPGDVLTQVNGDSVATASDVVERVRDKPEGTPIELRVLRNDASFSLSLEVGLVFSSRVSE